jgi:hypothetical protein
LRLVHDHIREAAAFENVQRTLLPALVHPAATPKLNGDRIGKLVPELLKVRHRLTILPKPRRKLKQDTAELALFGQGL